MWSVSTSTHPHAHARPETHQRMFDVLEHLTPPSPQTRPRRTPQARESRNNLVRVTSRVNDLNSSLTRCVSLFSSFGD